LALKWLVEAQSEGAQVGYIDLARSFDTDYACRCGLDLSRLLVLSPYDLREALAMTEALASNGGLAALVFDGWDLLWDDPTAASLLAASLARLAAPLARSNMAFLVLHAPANENSPALSALAYHASLRVEIARENWLRRNGDVCGYKAKVLVLKNKLSGTAGQSCHIIIEFNGTVHGASL